MDVCETGKVLKALFFAGCLVTLSGCVAQPVRPTWSGGPPGPLPPDAAAANAPMTTAHSGGSPATGRLPVEHQLDGDTVSASTPPGYPFAEEEAMAGEVPDAGAATAASAAAGAGGGDTEADYTDPADPVEDWLAQEGQQLDVLLKEWGDRAGWRVIWSSDRKYRLDAGAMFRGRFADVSAALLRAFARATPPPYATYYKGNRVLVVKTMEDENAD